MSDNHTPPRPEDMGEHLDEELKETVDDWSRGSDEELDDLSDRIDRKLRRTVASWVDADEDAEWKDIGSQMDAKTRAAIAGWVGVEETADWNTISGRIEQRIRVGMARVFHARPKGTAEEGTPSEPEPTWNDIGQKIEHDVRGWVAALVGTREDADWQTIGNRVFDQVRAAFDKARSGSEGQPRGAAEKIHIETDEAPPATREDIPPAVTDETPVEPEQ